MSFINQENSTEDSAPIELYRIEGQDQFFYTSSNTEVEYEGNQYIPVAISRSGPVISSKDSSGSMTVTFPFNNEFCKRYLAGTPPSPDKLTIFQVHLSDAGREVVSFWAGTVSSVKFTDSNANVVLAGLMSKLTSQVPDQTFSWACNHVLYGSRCSVSEAANTFLFNVTAVSADGVSVTVQEADPENSPGAKVDIDPTFFQGGTFRNGDEGSQRMLINMTKESSDTYDLVLLVPIQELAIGDSVSISSGCDRSIQICKFRYDNTVNYGGFTFIPALNPFSTDVKRDE